MPLGLNVLCLPSMNVTVSPCRRTVELGPGSTMIRTGETVFLVFRPRAYYTPVNFDRVSVGLWNMWLVWLMAHQVAKRGHSTPLRSVGRNGGCLHNGVWACREVVGWWMFECMLGLLERAASMSRLTRFVSQFSSTSERFSAASK